MKALLTLLRTNDRIEPLLLRLFLGVAFFPHGAQKVFGWFGGYGFAGTLGFFTQQMHIPALSALLAIAAEFAGSLGLIVGLLTRVAAFGILANMVVAVATAHSKVGFFMNWSGTFRTEMQVNSWAEHVRQHARTTKAEAALAERVWSMHAGDQPPVVRHYLPAERGSTPLGFGPFRKGLEARLAHMGRRFRPRSRSRRSTKW